MNGPKVFGFLTLSGDVVWTREWTNKGFVIRATGKDCSIQLRPERWIDEAKRLIALGLIREAGVILSAIRDLRVVVHDFKTI